MACKTKYWNFSPTKIRILNLRFCSCGWNEGLQFYVLITFRFIFYSSTATKNFVLFYIFSSYDICVIFFSAILSFTSNHPQLIFFLLLLAIFIISQKFYMYFIIFLSFIDIHEWNWILLLIYCLNISTRRSFELEWFFWMFGRFLERIFWSDLELTQNFCFVVF